MFENMTALQKTFLRLILPIFVFLILIVIAILVCKIKGKEPFTIHAFWKASLLIPCTLATFVFVHTTPVLFVIIESPAPSHETKL